MSVKAGEFYNSCFSFVDNESERFRNGFQVLGQFLQRLSVFGNRVKVICVSSVAVNACDNLRVVIQSVREDYSYAL